MRATIQLGCAAFALVAFSAVAADASMQGKWEWNAAESKTAGTPPKSATLNISKDDGKVLKWTMLMVDADGKKHAMKFDGAYDGKERAVGDGSKIALSREGDKIHVSGRDSKGSWTETCSTTTDQKRMTCQGTSTDKDGKKAEYTDVYDRK